MRAADTSFPEVLLLSPSLLNRVTAMTLQKYLITAVFFFLFITNVSADPALHDIDGRKIPLASLKGKWVYIHYWASWCEPCLEEIPTLNRFYNRFKSNNVILYGVNYDALSVSEQKQLVRDLDIRYPNLSKDPATLLHLGDIRGVPATFIFNPQGKLHKTLYGPQTINSLKRVMG